MPEPRGRAAGARVICDSRVKRGQLRVAIIEGWEIAREPGRRYVTAFRFYGARNVVHTAEGPRPERADSWRLVREVRVKTKGGSVTLPDFELEPTDAPGAPRLYKVASVFMGREKDSGAEDELLLPSSLGERLNFARLLLWNLERLKIIAPGQLDD